MKLISIVSSIFFCISFMANAEEWSYSDKKGEHSIRLSISTCYDDPNRFYINFDNTIEGVNYNNKSVAATCDCGDDLILNDTVKISATSFADVVKNGLPLLVKNYTCQATQ